MKRKILVVDDSTLARRLTRKMLEDAGYEVDEAADGAQALEKYALAQHDLVVLDLVMHGMYGLDVLLKLRQINPALPVMIATADIQRTTRDQVKEAGAVGIVNKPINPPELTEAIAAVWAGGTAWT